MARAGPVTTPMAHGPHKMSVSLLLLLVAHMGRFIRNVGSVCAYAFLGTTISTFVVGLMMWGFGAWGWCYKVRRIQGRPCQP